MKRTLCLFLGLLLTLALCACKVELPTPSTTLSAPETTVASEPVILPSGPTPTKPTEAPCQHAWSLDESREHTATCTEDGLEYYICTLCKEKKSEPKEAIGHNWANIRLVSGDCETGMTYHQRCRRCEIERDTTYQAGEHLPDLENPGRTYEPTCETEGFTYFYCQLCGERLKEVLPALGHSYGEDGLCTACGKAQPETPESPDPSTDPTADTTTPTT